MQFSIGQSITAPGWAMAGLLWLTLALAMILPLVLPSPAPINGLAAATGWLTLFVAATVATFSLRYMAADRRPARFFLALGSLVACVMGVLFTNNALILAAAWCASGWLLTGLIGHAAGWQEAAAAARRTRWAYAAGDGALLSALGLLVWQSGTIRLDAILAQAAALPPLVASAAALLLVVAAAARCALPPFSGWLLSSMTAPTPVSALMHAGIVNAGGILLIRFSSLLEAAPAARLLAVVLGLCGALYGVGIMLVRPDVKRGLAGSTVSQMGFMIMSCGLGAYAAALWHIVAHGLFKAWLFLGSGSAIGKTRQPGTAISGFTAIVIAGGTLGLAISISTFGDGGVSLVPLLLALATATASLVAFLGGTLPARARVRLLLLLVALVLFHGVGLTLAGLAIGEDGPTLLPDWAMVVLLLVFLSAWAWQQHRFASGRGLPLPVYVHLMTAGALPAATKGEQK